MIKLGWRVPKKVFSKDDEPKKEKDKGDKE
jgi:hypothetical protein